MNAQELQIQLSTQLPNVLCSMISDYCQFRTLRPLLSFSEEEEVWSDLLSHLEHLGEFPKNAKIHYVKMDQMDKLEWRVQHMYYFDTFGGPHYRETEALVKLENECFAHIEYSCDAHWYGQKLEVYLSTTIEELLNLLGPVLSERVWQIQ